MNLLGNVKPFGNSQQTMGTNQFNNIVEQTSQCSSIHNGLPVGERSRQLPLIMNKSPEHKNHSPSLLPIGYGQYSNQSNLGYNKLMQLIQQNKIESNNRINTMFFNQSEKHS